MVAQEAQRPAGFHGESPPQTGGRGLDGTRRGRPGPEIGNGTGASALHAAVRHGLGLRARQSGSRRRSSPPFRGGQTLPTRGGGGGSVGAHPASPRPQGVTAACRAHRGPPRGWPKASGKQLRGGRLGKGARAENEGNEKRVRSRHRTRQNAAGDRFPGGLSCPGVLSHGAGVPPDLAAGPSPRQWGPRPTVGPIRPGSAGHGQPPGPWEASGAICH